MNNKNSLAKIGEKNPSWKGDKVSYGALHDYIKWWKEKPTSCENCGKIKLLDLANKIGDYKRDLDGWWYICRKCHMDGDGRNKRLRQSGKSRRIPDKICEICGKEYHRTSGMRTGKYCSRKCWAKTKEKNRKCSICDRKHNSLGLCSYHYQLKRKQK